MKVLRFIPIVLSFIMLAAHFSRYNMQLLALISLLLPFLLFVKRRWAARVIQIILLAGTAEWIFSLFNYINIREFYGQDWTRLAVILSGVALFTLLSALIFETKAMKRIYKRNRKQ